MVRLTFVTMLVILAIVASFVSRCEQKSTAGMPMMRLVAAFFPVTALTDASRNKRIAGGRLVRPSQYPWIVSINIQYSFENNVGNRSGFKKRCTGSFIDIYGSVLTAGHCFRKRMYHNEEGRYGKLANATITWGSISPLPFGFLGGTARIRKSDIRRFKRRGLRRRKGKIDIALAFVHEFEETPMSTDPEVIPAVRPLELATVIKPIRPEIPNGTLIGFGAQPVMFNDTAWTYEDDKPLREISMQYNGHFREVCGRRVNPRTKARLLFGAHAIINQPTHQEEQLPPMYRGACSGDSGGPYVVMEGDQLRLRGVTIRAVCSFNHPCSKLNGTSTFVDVNHKRVRAWLIKELGERYNLTKLEASAIPMTEMQSVAHNRHARGHL